MTKIILQNDLNRQKPNYLGKHPKDMNKYEYNSMMRDAVTGKLEQYPEQKKLFEQYLEDQLNNIGNSVQIESKPELYTDIKLDTNLIELFTGPFTKRCVLCGKIIDSGNYCSECFKTLIEQEDTKKNGE